MSADAKVLPFTPRTMRYAHEFTCSGCGQQTYCAVHWGPIDVCLTCQFLGPEVRRAFLAATRRLGDA